jgi:predicted transcriptional regulator
MQAFSNLGRFSEFNRNAFWTEQMKLSQIVEALEARVLSGDDLLEKDIDTCGASDLMSDILAGLSEGSILLTGLTTVQVVRTAMVAGVGAVIFVRGKTPPQQVIDLAREQELPLISSPYSMFVSCGRLHACNLTGLDGRR